MKSRGKRARASWTLKEFCRRHAISRAHFYRLIDRGTAPRILVVGRCLRITRGAESDWVIAHEKQALDRRPRRPDLDRASGLKRRDRPLRRPRPLEIDRNLGADDEDDGDDGRW
jgi:predicted DNA-binding transcriptional regulator AlpA